MDKNAIKKYAVWARRELISRVTQKALQYGITETEMQPADASSVNGVVLSAKEKKQRQALIAKINDEGFDQVMEEVAYTWFNRFSALRFMEVNGYLPTHVRVFTDEENNFKPQILAEAINLEIEGLDMEKVYALKDANDNDTLFKYLIITQCNALSAILPGMFQKIDDYTELLFPDNFLREGSAIEQMIAMIPEEDWQDAVQIIGWLYQYYNAEKKDDVFAALKGNVKITKENIPAATQLFTPDWIVRYMVENSLGRLWLEGHPNEELKSGWKYYLEEAEQEPEVQAQLAEIRKEYEGMKPENIRCIDPCSGSGHILAYLFDVLVQIYETYGYTAREAAASIVENNLYGLDIDDRAAQLANFAVMMKARQYDRRFFSRGIQPKVYAIQESNHIQYDQEFGDFLLSEEHRATLRYLLDVFQDAKEYGSILTVEQHDYAGFLEAWKLLAEGSLENIMMMGWYMVANEKVPALANQAIALSQKYDVVVTNPPYMGSSGMSAKLGAFVKKYYPDSKSDMSTVCMEKTISMCKPAGYMAMINIPVWMFLSSFEKLRAKLFNSYTMVNMVHPGRGVFGSDFGTTTFVISNNRYKFYKGTYRRLFEVQGEVKSNEELEASMLSRGGYFSASQDNFRKIPGEPVAYWVGDNFASMFAKPSLRDIAFAGIGMRTGDNERFLRFWHEISSAKMFTSCATAIEAQNKQAKWIPYNKGGNFRRWYGNNDYVVNWENDGFEIKENTRKVYPQLGENLGWKISNEQYYFQEGITWTVVSSKYTSFRRYTQGAIISNSGQSVISNDSRLLDYLTGLLNTNLVISILGILSPTIGFESGYINKIPVIIDEQKYDIVVDISQRCISISRDDWDSFETSWDFQRHPLVRTASVADAFDIWTAECNDRFNTLKANEEELNRIFIDIYGLQDELTPEVEDKDVTVRQADLQRDIKSLISYAVGCMFGRYSLDAPGLAFAGGEWDASKYTSFPADKDNIIPICNDGDYFEDDIVGRFVRFIEVVYGKESLKANLQFIADALGGKGQPKEVIRNYFLNDFYKDHCKIYQKRPIYWQFDSGKKNGFKCLIYMHRYQPDTIARIRTDYVHEQQGRYRTAIADLEKRMEGASTSDRVKLSKQLAILQAQAVEIHDYEEKIHHLADQYISIDLDDGVKVNYAKFQDVLAKIK